MRSLPKSRARQTESSPMQTDQAAAVTTNHKDRAGGAPPRNKNAVKHGLYAYQAMLNGKCWDERTSLFKAMREKELELITALGGDPSPQQQAIIATPSRTCSTSQVWIII